MFGVDYYTPTAEEEIIYLKDYTTHTAISFAGTPSTNSKKCGNPETDEPTSSNVTAYSIKGNGGGKNLTITISGCSSIIFYHESHSSRYIKMEVTPDGEQMFSSQGKASTYLSSFELDGSKSYSLFPYGYDGSKQDLYVYAIKLIKAESSIESAVEDVVISGETTGYLEAPMTFIAAATPAATEFQWEVDGSDYANATSSIFEFTPTEAKTYSIVCKARNEFNAGWIKSNMLEVVIASVQLADIIVPEGVLTLPDIPTEKWKGDMTPAYIKSEDWYCFPAYEVYNSTNQTWQASKNSSSSSGSWDSKEQFPGSAEWTGTARYASLKENERGPYYYRVTNCTDVAIYGISVSDKKRTIYLEAYELNEGIATGNPDKQNSFETTTPTVISISDLDPTKEYAIVVRQECKGTNGSSSGNSNYYAIAFKAPVVITADPVETVTISGDESGYVGLPVTFTATATPAATEYKWLVNGVEQSGETTKTFEFTPKEAKTYAITCQARNEFNAIDEWIKSNTLEIEVGSEPLADIIVPAEVLTLPNIPNEVWKGDMTPAYIKSEDWYCFPAYEVYNSTKQLWQASKNSGSSSSSWGSKEQFPASSEWTGTARYAYLKENEKGPYYYRVTNCTDVAIYGISVSDKKRTIYLEAYELNEGIATGNPDKQNSFEANTPTVISISDLDPTKEYAIVVRQEGKGTGGSSSGNSNYYAIAFKAPVVITADPVETVTISGDESGYVGLPVTFTATAEPVATEYQWFVGEDKQEETTATFTFTPSEIKDYTITCQARNTYNGETWIPSNTITYSAAKLCGELISYVVDGGTTSKDIKGGLKDVITPKVSLTSKSSATLDSYTGYKMDANTYVGVTLTSGTFKVGDEISFYITKKSDVGTSLFLYNDENGTKLLQTLEGTDTGWVSFILTEETTGAYLYRAKSDPADYKQNPYVAAVKVTRDCNTEPTLEITPTEIDLKATATAPVQTAQVNISGKNLAAGTYSFDELNVAGLTVEPANFVVGENGILTTTATFTYTSKEAIEAASTTATLTVGTASASVKINYSADIENYDYATSINIEQLVLENGVGYDIKAALDAANIEYTNIDVLDSLNDAKDYRNYGYLGLKLKKSGATIGMWVKAGSTLNVRFGFIDSNVKVSTETEALAKADYSNDEVENAKAYTFKATEDTYVLFTTPSDKTVVFKQIMIDEDIKDVTLPPAPVVNYNVTWKVEGQEDKVEEVESGSTPSYGEEDPSIADNAQYKNYSFIGWKHEGDEDTDLVDLTTEKVTADITYVAVFSKDKVTYTIAPTEITDKNGNKVSVKTTLDENNTVAWGETIELDVTLADGYKVKSLNITYVPAEGGEAQAVEVSNNYTFTMPVGNVTIEAEFVYTKFTYEDGKIYLIKEDGTLNTEDFITGVTLGENAVEDFYFEKVATFGNTCSGVSSVSTLDRVIMYNTKTNQTHIKIDAYNGNSSEKQLYCFVLNEGETSATDRGIKIDKTSISNFEFDITGRATLYVCVSSKDIKIGQVSVTESGDEDNLIAPVVGYSINLKNGRVFAKTDIEITFENITYKVSSDYKPTNNAELKIKGLGSSYIYFKIPDGEARKLLLTASNNVAYSIAPSPNPEDNTETITSTQGVPKSKILEGGTWYINPTSSELKITNIAFSEAIKHTVTFVIDDETQTTQEVWDGEKVERPKDPTKEGFEFGGWFTEDGKEYDFNQAITENLELIANWKQLYTVTYNLNGATGTTPTETVKKEGAEFTLHDGKNDITAPDNHQFAGWSDGTTTYEGGAKYTMPAHDVTLTAKWNEILSNDATLKALSVDGYTLSPVFDPARETYTIDLKFYEKMPISDAVKATPTVEGATPKITIEGMVITIVVTAADGKTEKTYTITGNRAETPAASTSINIEQLVLDNGKGYDIESAFVEHNITKEGFEFNSDNALDSLDESKNARNYPYLGLKVKKNTGAINLVVKDKQVLNVKLGYIDSAVKLSVKVNEKDYQTIESTSTGTTFTYTASGDSYIQFLVTGTDKKTVVFKQIMIGDEIASVVLPYRITFISDGETYETSVVDENTTIEKPADPTKDGYKFLGWYLSTDESKTIIDWTETTPKADGNLTFVAKWEEVIKEFAINISDDITNGSVKVVTTDEKGEQTAVNKAEVGTELTIVAEPEDDCYELKSVSVMNGETDITPEGMTFTMPEGEVTVSAEFAQKTFTVTFYTDGNLVSTISNIICGSTISEIPAGPEKTEAGKKYTFVGWFDKQDNELTSNTTINDNIEYYARYTSEDIKYTITFKYYNEAGEPQTVPETLTYGATITAPQVPATYQTVEKVYTFTGWEPELKEGATVTGDAEYVAQYTDKAREYTITWVIDGEKEPQTLAYGVEIKHIDPVKAATAQYTFKFKGWDPELKAGTKVTGDATYTAVFDTIVNQYTITFKVDGDVYGDVQTVDYGTVIVAPEVEPTKASDDTYNYYFAGWTVEGTETIVTFDENLTLKGNIVFVAVFNKVEWYTIRFVDKDGKDIIDAQKLEKGVKVTVPTEVATITEVDYIYTWDGGWTPELVKTAQANVTYTATYSKTIRQYDITWAVGVYGDDDVVTTKSIVTKVNYDDEPVAPTKEDIAELDGYQTISTVYTFKGWTPAIVKVKANATYTAEFDEAARKYQIAWIDGDGKELKTDSVAYGEMPKYEGATPTKTATKQFTYEFNNTWSPEVVAVKEDAKYYAQFESKDVLYTVTFVYLNEKAETITEKNDYKYEETLVVPEIAKNFQTATTVYKFTEWNPAVPEKVTADVTYTAQYFTQTRYYTVIFYDEDGVTELWTTEVEYGTDMSVYVAENYPEDKLPVAEKTIGETIYEWKGWEPDLDVITSEGVTYKARYAEKGQVEYTIRFLNYDNKVLQTSHLTAGKTPVYSGTPVKPQDDKYTYEFSGWAPEIYPVDKDQDYVAQFTAHERFFTITWMANGHTITTTVKAGEKPVPPTADELQDVDGYMTVDNVYTFDKWNPEIVEATENTTYTATYTSVTRKYQITWDVEGKQITESVEYNAVPKYPNATPTKTSTDQYDYEFDGWYPEVVAVTEDAKYTAQFNAILREYTITWVIDGKTETQTLKYGEPITHEDPVKAATAQYTYIFKGWDPALEEGATVKGNATYTALFDSIVNKYEITWVVNDKTVKTESVAYGTMPTAPKVEDYMNESTVYTFKGWTPVLAEVTEDATYTAEFNESIREYEITWVVNDKTIKTESVAYGTMPIAPKVEDYMTESTVYTFKGWNPALAEVTEDATYIAQFNESVREYDITWVVKGETTVEKVNYGEMPVAPKVEDYMTESTVYTFKGWNPEVVEVTEDAQYEAIFDEAVRQYEITWIVNGQTTVTKVNYDEMPIAPQVNGYQTDAAIFTFDHWTPELVKVTANATYTAVFTPTAREYQITWMARGEVIEVTTVAYGEMPVGPQVENFETESAVYTFNGWSPALAKVTKNATYTAQFTTTARYYQITWIVNGETTVTKEKYGVMPTAPEVEDYMTESTVYTFKGWTPEVGRVAADVTYEAQFNEAVREYEITWIINGKTTVEKVAYGTIPVAPQVEDYMTNSTVYTFIGWTPAVAEVTADATYEAVFEEADREYEITWIVNGQTTVTKEKYGVMPTAPEVEDYMNESTVYTFKGWTPKLEAVTADATYEAQFTKSTRQYEITWIVEGETTITKVNYGEMPKAPKVENYMTESTVYTFVGWTPEVVAVAEDATYEAVFEESARMYTLVTMVNEEAYGSVEGNGDGITEYEYGTKVEIEAVAADGYVFDRWMDDPEAPAIREVIVDREIILIAVFRKAAPTSVEEINDEDAVYDNGVVRNLTGKTIYVYSAAGQLVNATNSDLDMSQMQRGAFVITNGNWSIRVVIP